VEDTLEPDGIVPEVVALGEGDGYEGKLVCEGSDSSTVDQLSVVTVMHFDWDLLFAVESL
jgi:hypothetical protein